MMYKKGDKLYPIVDDKAQCKRCKNKAFIVMDNSLPNSTQLQCVKCGTKIYTLIDPEEFNVRILETSVREAA